MTIGTASLATRERESPDFGLTGRKAFVTGGSRGIGRAIALALASAGADVAIGCNSGGPSAEQVCRAIRESGGKAEYYARDIAQHEGIEEMCAGILEDFEGIDILVNNAGVTRDRSFKKMTKANWDEVLLTNLTGAFLITKQFIDGMAERGWGRVINIASVVGEIGNFGQANYAAAKAGLIGLTKTLAREYARKGVTVNAIAPGFINTRMLADIPDKALETVIGMTPVGRLGDPMEVGAGVLFLASPSAAFITGHVLDINGGLAM
jgi:NAD(P)-dependent dehydrogenase (short-subunit alcohol dehydrogenase family)